MGGETEQSVSGWTVDTLHSLMVRLLAEKDKRDEQRFDAQEKALADALLAAERAGAKAEGTQEKRLESLNEFREQQKDLIGTFLPRAEYDRAHTDLVERVEKLGSTLNEKIDTVERREGERRDELAGRLAALQATISTASGHSAGLNAGWGYIVGAAGFIGAVIGIVLAVTAN